MKIIRIFPIMFAALTNRAIVIPDVSAFKEVSVSPLYIGKESTFSITTNTLLINYKFIISNDLYDNQVILEGTAGPRRTTILKYNNEYTRSQNRLRFEYKIKGNWTSSGELTMRPIFGKYRFLFDNESFSSTGCLNFLSVKTLSWYNHEMDYYFSGFDGLYVPDYYHKIRLEDFRIDIDAVDRKFFHSDVSLVINNLDNVFNDVSTSNNVEFKLKTIETDTGFTFALQDTLYVHKATLMMSKTQKDGYVATKHIYFPRNQMQKMSSFKAYFSFQNFGIDIDYMKHNFEFKVLKNTVGDCRNSEYCVQRLDS